MEAIAAAAPLAVRAAVAIRATMTARRLAAEVVVRDQAPAHVTGLFRAVIHHGQNGKRAQVRNASRCGRSHTLIARNRLKRPEPGDGW